MSNTIIKTKLLSFAQQAMTELMSVKAAIIEARISEAADLKDNGYPSEMNTAMLYTEISIDELMTADNGIRVCSNCGSAEIYSEVYQGINDVSSFSETGYDDTMCGTCGSCIVAGVPLEKYYKDFVKSILDNSDTESVDFYKKNFLTAFCERVTENFPDSEVRYLSESNTITIISESDTVSRQIAVRIMETLLPVWGTIEIIVKRNHK